MKKLVLLVLVVLAMTVVPCLASELRIGVSEFPSNSEDLFQQSELLPLLSVGLVELSPKLEILPAAAEAWEIREDGREWVFNLRPGLQFIDGRELTADDVVTSLLENPNIYRLIPKLADVYAIVASTVVIELYSPDAALLQRLASPYAKIFTSDSFPLDGREPTELIGLGPYAVQWHIPYESMRLYLADYETAARALDLPLSPLGIIESWPETILLVYIPEDATRRAALAAGEIDVAYGPISYNEINWDAPYSVFEEALPYRVHLGCLLGAPLDEPLVRAAVALAIDRQELADCGFPYFSEAYSLVSDLLDPDGELGLAASAPMYDPALAWDLLVEAGYPDGFSIDLYYPASYDFTDHMVMLLDSLREQLLTIGIDVILTSLPRYDFVDIVYGPSDQMGLFLTGWWPYPTADSAAQLQDLVDFRESSLPEEVLDVVEAANAEIDPESREFLVQLGYQWFMEELLLIPLVEDHSKRILLFPDDSVVLLGADPTINPLLAAIIRDEILNTPELCVKANDGNGHALPYVLVEVTVGGQTFKATTDMSGIARFKELNRTMVGDAAIVTITLQDGEVGDALIRVLEDNRANGTTISGRATVSFKFEGVTLKKGFNEIATKWSTPGPNVTPVNFSVVSAKMQNANDLATIYYYYAHAAHFALNTLGIDKSLLQCNKADKPLPIVAFSIKKGAAFCSSPLLVYIRMDTANSMCDHAERPINIDFHEYSHFIMWASEIGGTGSLPPGGENHKGLENNTSADSWCEGFAEFMALVMRNELGKSGYTTIPKNAALYITAPYNLEDSKNWNLVTLTANNDPYTLVREELAVAALLWDLYDDTKKEPLGTIGGINLAGVTDGVSLPIQTLWPLLESTKANTIADLYDELSFSIVAANISVLLVPLLGWNVTTLELAIAWNFGSVKNIFIAHGYFQDTGNNGYDSGEPVGCIFWNSATYCRCTDPKGCITRR